MKIPVSTIKFIQRKMNFLPKRLFEHTSEVLGRYPPVFIIGAPRSGTTLLYQLVVQNIHCIYINNLMALFPCWMVGLSRFGHRSPKPISESEFGYVPGLFSPNEAGPLFHLWFDHPDNHEKVRSLVARLSSCHQSFFISKNLFNVFRVNEILTIFPNAKFIICRRDPKFVAQSIYLARLSQSPDNPKNWFSVKPEGYLEYVNKPPLDQIIWQLEEIEKAIDHLSKQIDASNLLEINYEAMCEEPGYLLNSLKCFFGGGKFLTESDIPELRNNIRISSDLWNELKEKVEQSKILYQIPYL
jgi:hypothetical protein